MCLLDRTKKHITKMNPSYLENFLWRFLERNWKNIYRENLIHLKPRKYEFIIMYYSKRSSSYMLKCTLAYRPILYIVSEISIFYHFCFDSIVRTSYTRQVKLQYPSLPGLFSFIKNTLLSLMYYFLLSLRLPVVVMTAKVGSFSSRRPQRQKSGEDKDHF